ncbi:LOW QUALITY PROTEIN: protein mono-ADP-ribosyltransferase PARP14-like [Dicentrarchus labrax]|uniref:LOW QUALITY PROTEIN: protein mono-ADP-ribosyltransferase PARP14-like n=1 Tax=Dicentrarchus labrax TaxID=13489 RepID=UPI0021F686B1|nr:LOW QUALITY PROTEIN: protein mono-ADP-ribosyltransferase PARP14-like [Dicentrarchus labrax]
MGDTYQYPVYFECPSLNGEQRKRTENYFQIRRRSGGGDCGFITNINDKVYSIAFKERDAQQRVLQKSEHVLEFASGPLVLTVRGSPGPTSKPVSPKLDLTSSQQQPSLTSSLTSGEEYKLQLDSYLLRYLKECPKAEKELEEELASVACSAQLYPEEERVLVRSLAQPGAVDENRNWKAEVDKLFASYLCHYEMDSNKIKALLQSCSSPQTTDEVKVYSEVGMAVVVGKCSQVKARLINVEDSHVKRGSRLGEKTTTICRLGEAKLRLLWKEIEHSLGRDFPGVKVMQGDSGQLVLEGSVEEILKAGEWITGAENLVLEKKASDLSPHFLTFLRQAYGGPGVLCDFLGVGDKVEVELRDTGLCFFSLTADKLNDTEKELQEKFKEVKFDVPNFSAVSSELREKLKSKTNELNQRQYRAQVVFGSNSTVFLLGNTKEVEELSEAVTQFILDQARIEGKVVLPFPELEQLLPELLQLNGFDYSGVAFHPLTSSSGPMMVLEGPSSKVTEVRNRLGPFLDSLVKDTVTIDLPGAVRYFVSPSGRENILSVSHSQKCLLKVKEQPHFTRQNLASGGTMVSSYSLCDGLQVLVCQGDITKQDADALVNAANEDLDHGGGVAAALSKAGGPQVQKESKALVKQTGKIPIGDVVVTTGGNLNCKKLLHAVGPVGGKSGGSERVLLEKTVQSALNLAEIMEFKSIAMPCISSGMFGVPVNVCSEAIVTAVKKFGSEGGRSLSRIILIDNRGEVVRAMQEACDRLLQRITTGNVTGDLGFQRGVAAEDTARGATAGPPGDGVHVEIIQGTLETQQAFQSAQGTLHLRGFTNDVNPDQASFYRHVSVTNDEITAKLGGVKLQIVLSDIIHENTDVIVNTTDFSNNQQSGVSKAILTAAGAALQAEFAQVGIPADYMCTTGPGLLGCREIIHASFKSDAQLIQKNCKKILQQCESKGYHSAAFPAINTGVAGMDSVKACKAMLDGMTSAITDLKPKSLSLIRIVILQQPVFQVFRSELENRFGLPATRRLNLKERAKQILKKCQDKCLRTSTTSAPQGRTLISLKPLPAVISVIGRGPDVISTIKRDLEGILQKQLVEREVDVLDFSKLDSKELEAVQAKVNAFEISLEHRRRQSTEGVNGNRAGNTARPEARDRSGSRGDVYVLKGLKEDVLSVIELLNRAFQKALCKDFQHKQEAMLALNVKWSIQDVNGVWHEVSLHDNYLLEEAHMRKEVSVDIKAQDGMLVKVNLRAREATNWQTGITYKIKRNDSVTTLELPPQWEPMHEEVFKKVELQPTSPEYQAVAQGFLKTAKYTIRKIERVQNLYLWNAYAVCRQRILAKNGPADLGEKSLYHGTSVESCDCIERDRFDRSFAGAHAAAYGKGVYFAVNAAYSANGFSPADAAGLKRLYVALVLTGRYTVGNSSMKSPPPRGSDRTDCFDTVVDKKQPPSMFVIFHDDQAYPEYLITFN